MYKYTYNNFEEMFFLQRMEMNSCILEEKLMIDY